MYVPVWDANPQVGRTKTCSTFSAHDENFRKQVTYVNSGLIPGNKFECLPLLSGGALHRNTENLLKTLADRGQLPRMSVISEFKLYLQELNGAAAHSQLRQYLPHKNSGEDYGF